LLWDGQYNLKLEGNLLQIEYKVDFNPKPNGQWLKVTLTAVLIKA